MNHPIALAIARDTLQQVRRSAQIVKIAVPADVAADLVTAEIHLEQAAAKLQAHLVDLEPKKPEHMCAFGLCLDCTSEDVRICQNCCEHYCARCHDEHHPYCCGRCEAEDKRDMSRAGVQ